MKVDRFPLQSVLPAKRYVIRDRWDNVVAEVNADSSVEALREARAQWPEAASAIIKTWVQPSAKTSCDKRRAAISQ